MNELRTTGAAPGPDRWTLIRDVVVLQGKLIVDGFRDLILVPVSLGAGVLSLIKSSPGPGNEFYELLRMGRRSERWINLFGAAERVYGPAGDADKLPGYDIDEIVTRVESFIIDEYQSGGVTKQAKNRLDQALELLHERIRSEKR